MKNLAGLAGLLLKYLQRRDGREITSLGFIRKLVYLLTWNPDLSVGHMNFMLWNIMFRVFSNRLTNQAANAGERQFALGKCADAVVSFKRAISLGHLPSRATLSCMLIQGREGVAQNIEEALRLVESVSHLCPDCEGMHAMCRRIWFDNLPLFSSETWSDHKNQYAEMALRSASRGSKYGRCELAYHTFGGNFSSTKAKDAQDLYLMAAHDGLDMAQFHYAHMCYRIQNKPQDFITALQYLLMAAAQGYIPAIQEVGNFHKKGKGVPKMHALAREWEQRAQKAIVKSK